MGTFTPRPYDFGGDVWLAVPRDRLLDPQEHQYGPTVAIESRWEDESGKSINAIPPSEIYLVDRRGRVVRRLDQRTTSEGYAS